MICNCVLILTCDWQDCPFGRTFAKEGSRDICIFWEDAFRLLSAVSTMSGVDKNVTIMSSYETRERGSFESEFHVSDALPVKEFLEAQLQDATDKSLKVSCQPTFSMSMKDDAATAQAVLALKAPTALTYPTRQSSARPRLPRAGRAFLPMPSRRAGRRPPDAPLGPHSGSCSPPSG